MKAKPNKFLFLVLLLIIAGCTLRHTVSERTIETNRIPPFKAGGPVKLTNNREPSAENTVSVRPYTITVDYRQYTEIAIRLLKGELEKKGVRVVEKAAKEIKLSIVDLKVLPMPGVMRCILNYTVETGDGYVRGKQVIGANWNFKTAIDMAVTNVAIGVLNDENVLNYVEK